MKVNISVGGKFHAFCLAEQLNKRSYLKKIFTSYPYFKLKQEGLPREKIVSLPLKEIIGYAVGNITYLQKFTEIGYYVSSLFDRQVSEIIDDCDIFTGWSGFSLFTIRKIRKSFAAKTIVERGSAHIEFSRDILLKEQERLGLEIELPSPHMIEKELEEYKQADYISVLSTFSKQTFLDKGFPPEKILMNPLGVDIETFSPLPKYDNIFRIIFVGMRLEKGLQYLLQALEELKLKKIELWLIGKLGFDIKPILNRHRGSFKYIGAIPHTELRRYYSQGSVFVLPSLEEGFALSLLEAMACGIPVICSDNTGGKLAVREGIDGFIVPTRDVEALKEKIAYLYQHPDVCKEMGRQTRQRVKDNFTLNHYGERIIDTYKNIVSI